ncbi:MAG: bifunctional YncE family protein/alkaline phosphatase family protein [Thermoguttaceae bacterium]|jgi:YVTN family beta-propeller protein
MKLTCSATIALAAMLVWLHPAASQEPLRRPPVPEPSQGDALGRGGPDAESGPGARQVGPADGGTIVPTGQLIRPAGHTLAMTGRPVDIALSPDGQTVFVKNADRLIVLDAAKWHVVQELPYPAVQEPPQLRGEAGSMHGLAVRRDGAAVYVSCSRRHLLEARRTAEGPWEWTRKIVLGTKNVNPCGVALAADGRTACVCLSMANALAIVDLDAGKVAATVPTGVCPFGVVLSAGGQFAYVSNFGGRHAAEGEHAEDSAGTPVVVDDRSIALSGTISRIDLKSRTAGGELAVGLHPADLTLSPDGCRLFVANANSDSVSVVETASFRACETISVRPEGKLPFGSVSNAVAVSKDGRTLFVANGGNNAVAVVEWPAGRAGPGVVRGFIPTGWFPGGVCCDGRNLYIANVKGEGSRRRRAGDLAWRSRQTLGSVTKVAIPGSEQLAAYTAQVRVDARVPQMLRAAEAARSGAPALPVPRRPGEPSTIEHVVYVLKENRTYDQVFGDLPRGNNDPKLCTYGRQVTPNQHALAEEFVLLDNYYCNGVVSADGHQWATQGAVTDYREKTAGDFVRGYLFGLDSLAYANCSFIWDSALLGGRSFRNYGEFDFPRTIPRAAGWFDVYRDFQAKGGKIGVQHSLAQETLRKYTCLDYPGWNLRIPDSLRLEAFLKEFREYEKSGEWPNLVFVYLPQDHTGGTKVEFPTPRAMVADNDLAVGRLVEAISHSRYWAKTVLLVNEDDPQDGWDHVDGHRSLCLVVGPYVKRRAVVSRFYNQLSVLHTIERILGLPSTAQLVAQSPTMEDCFREPPDLTAYTARPNNIPLDERNKPPEALEGKERELSRASEAMDFSRPDRIDDDTMNRILWHASMGAAAPYPAEFAGAHGKGLKRLNLNLGKNAE